MLSKYGGVKEKVKIVQTRDSILADMTSSSSERVKERLDNSLGMVFTRKVGHFDGSQKKRVLRVPSHTAALISELFEGSED